MSEITDLLDFIFERKKTLLYPEFEGWIRSSRRFRAFASEYRAKIRAKLNNAPGTSGIKDLRAELEAAFLLLGEIRFEVQYEKYSASKRRGPDFTMTFKTHTAFNVEVRRVPKGDLNSETSFGRQEKLGAVVVDKVKQMPAGIINFLWLVTEIDISLEELLKTIASLQTKAAGKSGEFFTRRGYLDTTDFLKQYARLSAIVIFHEGKIHQWQNAQAKHKAPPELISTIRRLGH